MDELTIILERLESCVRDRTWASFETQGLEIKPIPPTGGAWHSLAQSVCAFLNTSGGLIILGVKDEGRPHRHFSFPSPGYTEQNSGQLSALIEKFTDSEARPLPVAEWVRLEARNFHSGQVAVLRISALGEDKKFCRYQGVAYRRVLDRDELIPPWQVAEQGERRREMETARELRVVPGVTVADLSRDRINQLVALINQGQPRDIETLKITVEESVPFLERRRFITRAGEVTTLGLLACGRDPEQHLLFRSQVDAFVAAPNLVAQDKKTFRDNLLQLMESAHHWTLRNIQTGVSSAASGSLVTEYPERLIRESINNALAHRDYALNRPVQITLTPRESLAIRNPGQMPHELVCERLDLHPPIRRIFANPRARNPRLADLLKLHNKWEGKGIGMSELVHYALANQIDLPYYLFHSAEELSLIIPAGRVLDESTVAWFDLLSGFIDRKTQGRKLTAEEYTVLAYLLKSERANGLGRYSLALTPANNHFATLAALRDAGLIELHPASSRFQEVYIVCRELLRQDFGDELRPILGPDYARLDELSRLLLDTVAAAQKYSRAGGLNAKQVMRVLRTRMPAEYQKRGEEVFYRTIRRRMENLAPSKELLTAEKRDEWHSVPGRILQLRGPANRPLFRLNHHYQPNVI